MASEAYLKIRKAKNVEPWIKLRYLLVIGYGIGWIIVSIIFVTTPNSAFIDNFGTWSMRIILIVMDLLEFSAWVLLPSFKTKINRIFNYTELSLDISEEEIMKSFGGD